uniref:HECT domain-containing protein n=1 Tax=Sander lucioperca TaxID=283035 RepID=A0A8D0CSH6_SANLU
MWTGVATVPGLNFCPSPINDAETLMDAHEALIEASGILSLLGCPGFLHTLDQRQALVEEATRTYIKGRTQKAVEQLVAGLQELGIAEAIAKHPEVMKPLFVRGPKGLDMEDLRNLFTLTFSETGSNRRRDENQTFIVFPEANTCQVVLRLPLHNSYDNFVKFMESGILQSPIFGII